MMRIDEACSFLEWNTEARPRVAVVLGSGLGAFAGELTGAMAIPYSSIPDWPQEATPGHAGQLVFGNLGTMPVVVMSGRAHLYEGYTPEQVVFGVRVLGKLGVRAIVFSNSAGAVNPEIAPGILVLITDHINLQGVSPLAGKNDDALGPRFPDLSEAYSPALRDIAKDVGNYLGIPLAEGIYAAMPGPNFETPAEVRYLRAIGADLVGMSTVPEVIAANHMGMAVLAVSCVTNMAAGILPEKISHEQVLEAGETMSATLVPFLKELLPRFEF